MKRPDDTPTGERRDVRALRGWLAAEIVSLTGTRISMIAIPWFVLTTTGSATQTGLVALAEMGPMVVAKALGGPLIDRLGARRVAITCDLGSLLAVGAVPVLHHLGLLSFGVLLALVAVAGTLRGPGDAAKHALIPAVTTAAQVPMERVTGLLSTVERTASTGGAALAGALVAAVGPTAALYLDAATFGVSAAVLAWATVRLRPTREDTGAGVGGKVADGAERYWAQLRAGAAYLRREPLLLGLTLMLAACNMLDLAWFSVLVPVWAVEGGHGAGMVGLLFAVFSGASIVGSLAAAAWGQRLPRFTTYVVAFLVTGLPRFWVMAVETPVWAVLTVAAVCGMFSGLLNPILGAVFYERIPADMVGRVGSLSTSVAYALMPFGGLLGGVLVSAWGLSPAMLIVGAGYFVATMAPTVVPAFREMDRRPLARGDAVAVP